MYIKHFWNPHGRDVMSCIKETLSNYHRSVSFSTILISPYYQENQEWNWGHQRERPEQWRTILSEITQFAPDIEWERSAEEEALVQLVERPLAIFDTPSALCWILITSPLKLSWLTAWVSFTMKGFALLNLINSLNNKHCMREKFASTTGFLSQK